ncbi:hypothetical protein BDQ17DRAFT_1334100 [Cyathus striatus]|nr:hypothetical protein BDQ17DRAFT_1334100 [Cyathus striatus]
MSQPTIPDALTKATLDSYVESMLIQGFLCVIAFIQYNDAKIVRMTYLQHGTLAVAICIVDALLAWRCYILWMKKKWLLVLFSVPLVGEITLIPVLVATMFTPLKDGYYLILLCFLFISIGITVLATSIIIHRILTVSREAGTTGSAVLIPVTGIAPTLIAERVMNCTEKDEEKWSQPISTLRFHHTTQRGECHEN